MFQRIRVQAFVEICFCRRFGFVEQAVVQSDFGIDGMRRRHPVNSTLDLTPALNSAAFGLRVVGAAQLHDITVGVLNGFFALDDVGVAQTYFATGREAEKFLRRVFFEIILLDVQHARKRHRTRAGAFVFRVVDGDQFFHLTFGIILNDQFKRSQHCHDARRQFVQILAYAVLQHRYIHHAVTLGHADEITEVADGFRRVATPPQACKGRHAWVVPTADVAIFH